MKKLMSCAVFSLMLFSCDHKDNYDVEKDGSYEKSKETLAEREKKNPVPFLKVLGDNRRNILGQTVVRGKLYNNAKIVSYKDIELKMEFFSKTGALLEQDRVTIYETVSPGASKSFKTKYFTPKGTDSVGLSVTAAKF